MATPHKHQEPPRDPIDAKALRDAEADESLYLLFGLREGRIVCIGGCQYMTPRELERLLTEALSCVRGEIHG